VRFGGDNRVLVVLNLSGAARTVTLRGNALPGRYSEVFTGDGAQFGEGAQMHREPWAYRVYETTQPSENPAMNDQAR